MQTITEALRRDHNEVRRQIAATRRAPQLVTRAYPSIVDAIRRHSAAEEGTLYAAMRRLSPVDAKVVDDLEAGHRQIVSAMAVTETLPYGSPQFMNAFWRMAMLLDAHIAYEESTVFPHVERVMPRSRQVAIARRYDARMGEKMAHNVSILLPSTSRERNGCACKNPCGCKTRNAKRRLEWHDHFTGIGGVLRQVLG